MIDKVKRHDLDYGSMESDSEFTHQSKFVSNSLIQIFSRPNDGKNSVLAARSEHKSS